MKITHCLTNHLTNPLGYDFARPVFSWQVEDAAGKTQTAARIVVRCGGSPVADTGWANLDSLAAPVDLALRPRTRYTWTVAVRTDAGEQAESAENWFETAKQDEPWQAAWIGCDGAEPRHPVFSCPVTPQKPVAAARLYICGLGLYEAAWNGEKIGGEHLTPYCNDYDAWVQYQTYDVTAQLQGPGVLSVTLGNGWYKGRFGFIPNPKPYYGDSWKLLAELRLTYADGSEAVIGTDASWQVTRSNLIFSNIYDGEQRDDTLPPPQRRCPPWRWTRPGGRSAPAGPRRSPTARPCPCGSCCTPRPGRRCSPWGRRSPAGSGCPCACRGGGRSGCSAARFCKTATFTAATCARPRPSTSIFPTATPTRWSRGSPSTATAM